LNNWEEWLQSLPDKSFFDLYRHYLSPLSTPYHKQDLIKEFTNWLSSDNVQKRILELLDSDDLSMLSLIYMKGHLSSHEAAQLKAESEKAVKDHLINLTERLLLIRIDDQYQINPLLKESLCKDKGLGISLLIHFRKQETLETSSIQFTDSLLTALLIFFRREEKILLNHGELSKRIKDQFFQDFPDFNAEEDYIPDLLLQLFIHCGLLVEEEGKIRLCSKQYMQGFSDLTYQEKRIWLLTKLADPSIQDEAEILLRWIITHKEWGWNKDDWSPLFSILTENPSDKRCSHWRLFENILVKLHILLENNGFLYPNPGWFHSEKQEIPPLIQPNGDISLLPETRFTWVLPYSTHLLNTGSMIQLHLDRSSFKQGCPYRIRSTSWLDCIEEKTGYPLDKLLATRLMEWDKEFYSLEIQSMICLKLNKNQKNLVKKSAVLEPYIITETREGDWLLDGSRQKEWLSKLDQLGIQFFPEYQSEDFSYQPNKQPDILSEPQVRDIEESKDYLLVNEEDLSGDFEPLAIKEIMSRQNRKTLLFRSQLDSGMIRMELRKAKGLDFNSKIRLIEAALSPPVEGLELTLPGKDLEMKRVLLDPQKLEGKGADATLTGKEQDSDEIRVIPIRKIIEVQRFPYSLI